MAIRSGRMKSTDPHFSTEMQLIRDRVSGKDPNIDGTAFVAAYKKMGKSFDGIMTLDNWVILPTDKQDAYLDSLQLLIDDVDAQSRVATDMAFKKNLKSKVAAIQWFYYALESYQNGDDKAAHFVTNAITL